MNSESQDPADQRKGRLWTVAAGALAFVALGLVVIPGVVQTRFTSHPALADGSTKAPEPVRPKAPPTPGPAESAEIAQARSDQAFDCMIEPSEIFEIGSSITGVVSEINVDRTDYVVKDQVLARLEASVEKAAVSVARSRAKRTVDIDSSRASLELGEQRRQRANRLFEKEALALDSQQEAEAQARLARLELERAIEDRRLASLQLEQATAALERRTIRSPAAGYVVERLMSPGEVADQETILRVAQVDPLRIQVVLPSSWFGRIQPGDRAAMVPEAPMGQARGATVSTVDPLIDGASGTFVVQLLLPNPDRDLAAGLRCQVSFPDTATQQLSQAR